MQRARDVLLEVSRLMQATLDLEQFARPLLDLLKDLVPYESATLYLLDARREELVCEAFMGDKPINLIDVVHFDRGSGLNGWIAQQRRPVILPSLRRGAPEHGHLVRSFIGLPLLAEDKLIGVLNFGHSHPGAFAEVEAEPLQILSGQLALLVRNLLLVRELRQSNRRLARSNRRLREMQKQELASERLKAISEVVTTMNHEINNPLTIISGNAELLQVKLRGQEPEIEQRLVNIRSQVRRLGRVMNLLANLQQPVSESYPSEGRKIDLQQSFAASFPLQASARAREEV